jgi:peptide chain release factor 1
MKIDREAIVQRLHEIESWLGQEANIQDRVNFAEHSKEHSYLSTIVGIYDRQENLERQIKDNEELLSTEKDQDFISIIEQDLASLRKLLAQVEKNLRDLLVPPSADDDRTTIVELRAGAGGQEAMLFVADCVRMYQMYAQKMGWKVEGLSATPSDLGGFKEYVMAITGKNVWRFLRHEGGTHRVQRVPATEAQGRIHTSTITVAVLQEADEKDVSLVIPESDLRIETTRSSGAGGQHVNKTDSAVRITHIPTGAVVFCQEERSQHKNKDKALRYLRAKLSELERRRKKNEQDALRLEQVGSGDRSEKIRTYNYPQNRITDHRIEVTRYDLDRVMNGDLEDFSHMLVDWDYKKQEKAACPWILAK